MKNKDSTDNLCKQIFSKFTLHGFMIKSSRNWDRMKPIKKKSSALQKRPSMILRAKLWLSLKSKKIEGPKLLEREKKKSGLENKEKKKKKDWGNNKRLEE